MSAPSALRPLNASFHNRMRQRLKASAQDNGLDGHLLLQPSNVAYASGFFFAANERPVGLFVPTQGDSILFIPSLEAENAAELDLKDIRIYEEFPGKAHPLIWMLDEIGPKTISIDQLDARLLPAAKSRTKRVDLRNYTMEQRFVKEPEELVLICEAASFADLFLQRLHKNGADILSQGGTEQDLMNDAMAFSRAALMKKHRLAFAGTPMGITATVHSGPRAALPHGSVIERQPQAGETLIAGIGASLGGYHAESGATFIVGEMSPEQREIIEVQSACDAACAAATVRDQYCEEVNKQALDVIRDAGLGETIRHRIGHGMGLDGHEPPWLSTGERTQILSNMVFSIEPGIYRPGIDGYRAINTMITTDSAPEIPSKFQSETPIDKRIIAC